MSVNLTNQTYKYVTIKDPKQINICFSDMKKMKNFKEYEVKLCNNKQTIKENLDRII